MASCSTSRWVSTAPYVKLTVTEESSTATSATLAWKLQYIADYAASTSSARSYTVKLGGSVVKEGTYSINGKTGTYTIASGTKTIDKTTSSQSISFSVSFAFNLTWSGSYAGTKSASGSISVAAKTSYTVKYNANGGSGAPSSQTKTHGTALTLSSTKPTRTGYSFQGWATSSTGSVAYAAGGSYTSNASVTLYAVWKANTYTVSYNANGGSGAPSSQTKTYGVDLTLSSTKPTRANYTFKGWGTSASATTVSYTPGAKYTANSKITLYAIWELSYTEPRISGFSVARCDSAGVVSDAGTYALVKFNWACDKTVSSIKIEWKLAGASSWTNSTTVSATGTSGSVSKIIGDNALSAERTYSIRVTVTDASGSNDSTQQLSGASFPIDVKNGGDGISFGKPAEYSGYADFAYKLRLRDNMLLANGKSIYSRNAEDTTSLSILYVNASNNTVLGYGGYSNQIGTTNIYGCEVRVTSRSGVFVDGTQIAVNNVLWSGKVYMTEGQSATLTSAISKQANGIVLVWGEYSDGDAVNANFNMCFIPKHFVSAHAGKGVCLSLTSATMNVVAPKYVYISDTTIAGYANNNAAAAQMACGITATPKNFVLRYVIGV